MTETETTTALTPRERWITLDKAAKILDCSRRTVERMIKIGGLLHPHEGRLPGLRQRTRLVDPAEVRHLKHAIAAGEVSMEWQKPTLPAKLENGAVSRRDAVTVATSPRLNGFTQVSGDPWLTIEEAATYARLPGAYLRRCIASGELAARNVLPDTVHKSWRIKRSAIDDLKPSSSTPLSDSELLGLKQTNAS